MVDHHFITTPDAAIEPTVAALRGRAGSSASEADTVHTLLPLAHGTLDAIESAGIARGMPGPVSRGGIDAATAERLRLILGAATETEQTT